MNREFSFRQYRDLLLEHFTINSHWLHFLNFIDILVFKSVSYDKLGLLVLMSQQELSPFKKNIKIINFVRHMSTKHNTEEQFWEMLEPNNHYLAISKLDQEYDIIRKFNWFNLEKLIYDLKKYKPKNSFENNKINYEELYQNFILGHTNLQFEKNIKPYLIKFINNNYREKLRAIEPSLSGIIFNIIKPRHIVYYNINTEEKLNQLVQNKIIQLEEGQTFFNDVFELIKDYKREEIGNANSDLYKNFFPIIQSDHFKDKYPYIYRKLTYILEDYSDINSLVSFCCESNMFKSMRTFLINMIKKIILFDYKFNVDTVDINRLGYNTVILHIKTTNQKKYIYLKHKFFVNLCLFIIREKTVSYNENLINLQNLDEEIKSKIDKCNEFNCLVDVAGEYIVKKFNLSIETEFYRLIKN